MKGGCLLGHTLVSLAGEAQAQRATGAEEQVTTYIVLFGWVVVRNARLSD